MKLKSEAKRLKELEDVESVCLDVLIGEYATLDQVTKFLLTEDYGDEIYLFDIMEEHLMDDEDWVEMAKVKLDLFKMYRCHYTGGKQEKMVRKLTTKWNKKLGFRYFG